MTTKAEKDFFQRLSSGLSRYSIASCSEWAVRYRVMGKPFPGQWSWDHHPWLKQMHDDPSELIVGQKSAQMGFSECALNRTFYSIDIHGKSVLYILPATTPDAKDFSTGRFDPALELSPHLRDLFSDVTNIGHKRAGSANLYVRGSRSRSQLKSIPVSDIVVDELEEMNQDNVALAMERTSGQVEKSVFELSTPSVDGYGINKQFLRSDQKHFFFQCPHCSRRIELTFPESLVITANSPDDPSIERSHVICTACKHPIDHRMKYQYLTASGIWVPTVKDTNVSGYHINQLYSSTVHPSNIAKYFLLAQVDPAYEQELYNSKLGLPHTVEGSRVTDEDILACQGGYTSLASATSNKIRTIGIDVGKWLHVTIEEWELNVHPSDDVSLAAQARVIHMQKYLSFEEIPDLIRRYVILGGVIDANPETRKALELCQLFPGILRRCYYNRGVSGRKLIAVDDLTVGVDRTSWLDLSLGRFRSRKITLPKDTHAEYISHVKALVRIYEKDEDGNPFGRYVHTKDDHYAHSRNYSEIAFACAVGNLEGHQNI